MSFRKLADQDLDNGSNVSSPIAVLEEDPKRKPREGYMFDWSKVKKSTGCCSYLLQLILVASSGSFLFGFNMSLLNVCIDHIGWELEWCDWRDKDINVMECTKAKNYKAFISTAVLLGAAVGSMTGGGFMAFGRRGMILLSLAIFFFAITNGVVANSFAALLWARLLCGYAVGLISVCVPTYMSEVTPPKVRGFYGVFHQLFITVGILCGCLIGLPLALTDPIPEKEDGSVTEIKMFSRVWWRVMLGFGYLPVLLTLVLLSTRFKFETPHYYVENNSPQDAAELMKLVANKDDVSEELQQIEDDIRQSELSKERGMNLTQAFKNPQFRYVILVGCGLSLFQQLSGINVFIVSSNNLFKEAGLKDKWPTIISNIMNLVNCLMTLPAVPLIEKMGRRTLMIFGTAGQALCIAPAMICYWALEDGSTVTRWLAIVGCIGFIICFAMTYGPILWVYLFEIYPTEIKSAAAGLATAVNWIGAIVMVFITNYIENRVAFTIFLVMCLCALALVIVCMKETKGVPLGQSPFIKG